MRVGEHDALRLAGGAAGVDEARQVVGADRPGAGGEALGVGVVAAGGELVEILGVVAAPPDQHHLLDAGQVVRAQPLELVARLDEDHLRRAVGHDVARLLGEQGGVDRHRRRAAAEGGEVDHRPVRAVLGHQRHAVATADAELLEGPCDAAHPVDHLGGRDGAVLALHLVQQAVGLVVVGGDEEEIGQGFDRHDAAPPSGVAGSRVYRTGVPCRGAGFDALRHGGRSPEKGRPAGGQGALTTSAPAAGNRSREVSSPAGQRTRSRRGRALPSPKVTTGSLADR